MTDYFQELNCEPIPENETQAHQNLLYARFLQQHGILMDEVENLITAPPASKEVVANLKERKITDSDIPNVQCSICLRPNEQQDVNAASGLFKVLPCSHEFHASCVLPWLERTNSCPLCRHELKTDDEGYEAQKSYRVRQAQRDEEINMLHDSMFS